MAAVLCLWFGSKRQMESNCADEKHFHLSVDREEFSLAHVFALEWGASAAAGDWSDRCLRNDWIVTRPSGIDDDSRKSALRQGRMHIKPIGLPGFISCLIYAYLSRQIPAGGTQPLLGDLPWLQLTFTLSEQSGTLVISIDPFHIYTTVTLAPSSLACSLRISFTPCWECKYFTLNKPPINPSGLPCLHLGNEKRHKRRPSLRWSSHHKHPIKVP